MISHPTVSLIVSTIGRPAELGRLIDSLEAQRTAAETFELVVVDQSADQRCLTYLERRQPQLLWRGTRSEPGVSVGRNLGAEMARGRLLAFPDDDCWYHPSTVATALALTDAEESTIRTGRLLTADGQPSMLRWPSAPVQLDRFGVWRAALSSTMFIPAELFEALGAFDEELGVGARTPWQAGEDTDLLLRAIAAGAEVWFEPAIMVHHDEHDPTGPTHALKMRHYGQGIGRVLAHHRFPQRYVAWLMARKAAAYSARRAVGNHGAADSDLAWAAGVWQGYRDRTAA